MKESKLLALALSFEDAPKYVKKAAQELKDAYLRQEKAEDQFQQWNKEREDAKNDLKKSVRDFDKALKKWDPAKADGLEDAPVKEGK